MTEQVKVLPRVMSQLIRIALRDVEIAEKTEGVVVNMSEWHRAVLGGACSVCAAGAVARFGTGDVAPNNHYWLPHRSPINHDQYRAIDSLREGFVYDASSFLDTSSVLDFDCEITPYSESSEQWKADMDALATRLEEAGL